MNGLFTAPADLVEARPVVLAGLVQMPYRMFMGACDLALSLVPGLPVLGPVPRHKLLPWFEHPDE